MSVGDTRGWFVSHITYQTCVDRCNYTPAVVSHGWAPHIALLTQASYRVLALPSRGYRQVCSIVPHSHYSDLHAHDHNDSERYDGWRWEGKYRGAGEAGQDMMTADIK